MKIATLDGLKIATLDAPKINTLAFAKAFAVQSVTLEWPKVRG